MQKRFGEVYDDEMAVGAMDDEVLDQDLLRFLDGEELPEVSLGEVRAALAKIPGSMAADFMAEREERF